MSEPSHVAVRPSSAEPLGVGVALAAILVQAPRLVLAVLAADRQPVSAGAERALLVVAGVGTAVVLTGGNLYLAHSIARVRRWRRLLAAVWLAVLASSGGLVVPLVAAGLSGRSLPQLLSGEPLAWGWSLLAALAHEVTAAGCVLAAAAAAAERAAAERTAAEHGHAREIEELLRQRDAARRELAALRLELAPLRLELAGSERLAAGSGAAQRAERQEAGSGAGSQAERLAEQLACPEGCGRSFASAPAVAGHLRHCAVRSARLRQVVPLAAVAEP
jgi:MFS family permease